MNAFEWVGVPYSGVARRPSPPGSAAALRRLTLAMPLERARAQAYGDTGNGLAASMHSPASTGASRVTLAGQRRRAWRNGCGLAHGAHCTERPSAWAPCEREALHILAHLIELSAGESRGTQGGQARAGPPRDRWAGFSPRDDQPAAGFSTVKLPTTCDFSAPSKPCQPAPRISLTLLYSPPLPFAGCKSSWSLT